ncbi:MAG: GAF domain-containing protein [Chloroflexi bacterium CFX4]|nr:GAF domain-containing protein [Chloroflexi bacterium CFX4]MDL1923613.1 GAF domain-containing protein [Chloroflexi bacterium CFX3]
MSVGVPAFGDSDGANRIPNAARSNLFLFADTALASAALVLAIGVTVLGLLLSIQWYNQPFLGAFLYPTGNLISARPLAGGEWTGLAAGLRPGDRLQKIDDRILTTNANVGAALNAVLSELPMGHVARVQVLRFVDSGALLPAECLEFTSGVAECTFEVRLEQLPFVDWVGYWGIGFVVAVSVLAIGVWLWLQHRQIASARALIVIIAAGAITFVCRFEINSTYQLDLLMKSSIVALGFLLFQFSMVFPYPLTAVRRRRWLMPAVAVFSFVVLILSILLSAQGSPETYDLSLLVPLLFGVCMGVFFISSMIIRRRQAASAVAREQASVALVSLIVPLLPMALWWVTNLIERTQNIRGISFSTIYLQLPMIFFPLGMSYAVLLRGSSSAAKNDRLVNDALVLGALGLLLTVGYLALTGAAYLLTAGFIRPDSPFLIAGTLFVIALVFSPLRVRMERLVETAFFRQRRYYGQRLEQFTRDLATAIETREIVEKLDKELKDALSPQYSFIFVQNILTGDYEPITDRATRRAQTDIRFKADGGLIRVLTQSDTIINLTRENFPSADLQSDRPRLAVLNTPIIARMQSLRRLNGFIALGPYRDNTPYSHEDLRFLEGIATQAAAALERAQVVLESQQNERELKVLVQVSASLNIAMDYDTLLEFIYAQASKVIDAPNFYIVLYDDRTGELTYAFYQDDDERVPDKEGDRWQADRDIFSEIVRSAQPYRTDNYARDMQRRGATPENPQLRAWLGVPLNAGEGRCIGALALGTTEVGVTYTDEQTKLFWNIADLAATALYKLRLLEESKQLARQMQVLNATSSQLATFFEDIDALLQNITESAVAILDCEAGSLLLADDNQRNLIFRLAVGGSGDELIGTTIPIGSGIAGIVAATGQYMIVNDTQRDNRWYGELAATHSGESPFSTTSILAVPLSSRNRVIGVLEVINRRDGSGFDDNSANLLMTFAGQAAVAIENANLFRRTDEALAERVRQLFNMQRIDQELNRTLDFQRVVDLTVDNAIRESEADAALLALVSSDRLRFEVVGCAGYPERVVRIGDSFSIDHGILGHAYRRNRPLLTPTSALPVQGLEILPGTVSQIAVPMITGEKVTGILLLETTAEGIFSQLTAEHIEGIAEHANTAISNAQLFAQLGRANKQRIEFISKVAHEFKTPLSSIKGYADILNTRALGALNEQQQNFINIIQRNALRLQQLVEDFTDVTAQETGNLKLNMAAVNFSNVVLDTVRPMQRAFDEKEQQVVLNVPDDLPYVWGDERRLIQVMTNFVSNANKYTKPGGKVTIFAEHTRNVWDEGGATEVIHCAVTDTGIGMSQEDLQNLFKPYWRSENPDAREQPGTGLGMSLTRALIEAHGGRIWVESERGVGTTFHFTMPLAGEREKMTE